MVRRVAQITAIEKIVCYSRLPRGATVKLCRVQEKHQGGQEEAERGGGLGQGGFTEVSGGGTGEAGSVEQDRPV